MIYEVNLNLKGLRNDNLLNYNSKLLDTVRRETFNAVFEIKMITALNMNYVDM